MVKKLFLCSFLLGLLGGWYPLSELSAQDTIIVGGAWPTKNFAADLTIPSPAPTASALTEADSAKAGWVYFWMYDDGVFSRLESVSRSFPNNQNYNAALKVRGRYSDDPEPPRMPARVLSGGPTSTPLPADSMQQNSEVEIFSNWGAARIGDTIYLALSVKNRNDAFQTRSGRVSLLFPRKEFRYLREIFPSETDRFGNVSSSNVTETATLNDWKINNIPINQAQTLFIEMLVTANAVDNIAYLLQTKVDWDDEQTTTLNTTAATLFGVKSKDNPAPPNPFFFESESTAEMKVNRSRDPNALVVRPEEVLPSNPAPVHKLEYTVFVENIGTAVTPNLQIEVAFDNKVNPASFAFRGHDFLIPVVFPANPCCTGNRAIFDLNGVNLPPSMGGVNPAGKGSFTFTMDTKPGLSLQEGDKIRADGVIRMINNASFVEDEEETGPAIVQVRKPGRPCYGWLLGVKVHNHLPNPDSLRNTGVNLTFQIPLINPRQDVLKSKFLNPPSWFWQFELGLGQSTFNAPSEPDRYTARYVHLTPAQIRYTNIPAGPLTLGVSAGYSLCYVYGAEKDNVKTTLKSGFGDRLEHELAASLDVFNLTGVPGIALGVGYKHRFNHLFADKVDYGFPFASLQLNFARFQKSQIQIWNKIYRR